MKKAMLFVSFGSSYESARRDNIDKTVNYISSNFAEYDAFQAFTSNIIRKKLQKQGIDIRYVLLGIDPDFSGLTSEESLLLKAYRQLSPDAQAALLGLSTVYAKDMEKK